jgi:hypothetical protein
MTLSCRPLDGTRPTANLPAKAHYAPGKQNLMNGIFPMNGTFRASEVSTDRLFCMTLVNGGTSHRCMTIACNLAEAETRARQHYGYGYVLHGWQSRSLPIESLLIGGGYFIRSSRDEKHRHSLAMISSLR